jgi:hypothetical protein
MGKIKRMFGIFNLYVPVDWIRVIINRFSLCNLNYVHLKNGLVFKLTNPGCGARAVINHTFSEKRYTRFREIGGGHCRRYRRIYRRFFFIGC